MFRINVHAMPGPSKNHRAFLLEEERMLLCGGLAADDRLAPLDPGSSNVAALVESLEAASKMRLRRMAPVHGYIVEEAKKAVPAEIERRASVDAAILAALKDGHTTPDEIAAAILGEVDATADADVLAGTVEVHLDTLAAEKQAKRAKGSWAAA